MTGIVLAGGRSTRFGRDKLLEPVDGEPLLWRPIRVLAPLVDEVLVASAPARRYPLPPDLGVPTRIVPDERTHAGPVEGVHAALRRGAYRRALVVGGDMPSLSPDELRRLLAAVADGAAAAWFGEPLPCAVRVAAARAVLEAAPRSLRDMLTRLNAATLESVDAATLRDVDEPDDLPLA